MVKYVLILSGDQNTAQPTLCQMFAWQTLRFSLHTVATLWQTPNILKKTLRFSLHTVATLWQTPNILEQTLRFSLHTVATLWQTRNILKQTLRFSLHTVAILWQTPNILYWNRHWGFILHTVPVLYAHSVLSVFYVFSCERSSYRSPNVWCPSVLAHMQIHLPPFKCQLFHLFIVD